MPLQSKLWFLMRGCRLMLNIFELEHYCSAMLYDQSQRRLMSILRSTVQRSETIAIGDVRICTAA